MRVFIQNEAGSAVKHRHNEKTLQWKSSETVSRPYPFPYGFVIGTTAEDGDNVDCFVITTRKLFTGDVVECEPIGLMQQVEDGAEDHNVLARIPGEHAEVTEQVKGLLADFVMNVFRHMRGKQLHVGDFLGPSDANAHVASHVG